VKPKEYGSYMGLENMSAVTKKFPSWGTENKDGGLMYLTATAGGVIRLC
jgi:hypothetical protein